MATIYKYKEHTCIENATIGKLKQIAEILTTMIKEV